MGERTYMLMLMCIDHLVKLSFMLTCWKKKVSGIDYSPKDVDLHQCVTLVLHACGIQMMDRWVLEGVSVLK